MFHYRCHTMVMFESEDTHYASLIGLPKIKTQLKSTTTPFPCWNALANWRSKEQGIHVITNVKYLWTTRHKCRFAIIASQVQRRSSLEKGCPLCAHTTTLPMLKHPTYLVTSFHTWVDTKCISDLHAWKSIFPTHYGKYPHVKANSHTSGAFIPNLI